jgi:hypothetical protein
VKKKIKVIFFIFFVVLLSFSIFASDFNSNKLLKDNISYELDISKELEFKSDDYFNEDVQGSDLDSKNNKDREKLHSIKGIYLTGWVAGLNRKVNKLIKLINNTEINAVVIDVKNVEGEISYNSEIKLAQKLNANVSKIRNIRGVIKKCKANDIYTIARIPVFKDKKLAENGKHSLKFYDINSENTSILNSRLWVSPYSKEVWSYNVDLAIEAALMGFDEIQFDYIRFPSFLNLSRYNLAVAPADSKKSIINDFIAYAKIRLDKYKIPLSIDVFGLTTTGHDLGIGQDFEALVKEVDYISPMVYPSHYAPGAYGLRIPEETPYFTILNSMRDAKKRVEGETNKLRPWLQDFSLRHKYGIKEVKEQIQAAEALGLDSWLLWNPSSNYTWQAFLRNDLIDNNNKISLLSEVNGDSNVRID